MRGFLAPLTTGQRAAVLAYRGDENHGDEAFRNSQASPHVPADTADDVSLLPASSAPFHNDGNNQKEIADAKYVLPCCVYEEHLIDRRRQENSHEQDSSESRQVRSGRNIAGVADPRIGPSTGAPAESAIISAPIPHSAQPLPSEQVIASAGADIAAASPFYSED